MSKMQIITNNVPRAVLYPWDLSLAELSDFEYLIDDIASDASDEDKQAAWFDCGAMFFRYRGELYDIGEFVRIKRHSERTNPFCHSVDDGSPLLKWHGIQTDSFFSAIVIRYADDHESIVVGRVSC